MFGRIPHQVYYLLELVLLLGGFFGVYLLSYNMVWQRTALAAVLMVYALFGIFHHKVHHDLRGKIVVEYLLVSILIFACYLFLKI